MRVQVPPLHPVSMDRPYASIPLPRIHSLYPFLSIHFPRNTCISAIRSRRLPVLTVPLQGDHSVVDVQSFIKHGLDDDLAII